MTYLITFACYGCHLHGDQSGSVDRGHNLPGGRWVEADLERLSTEKQLMDRPAYCLDAKRRDAVLTALQNVCAYRCWLLLAAHVRTNHVHAVVEADARPEKVMNDFKAYTSRGLNRMGLDESGRKRWARHGSTRWLWNGEKVSAAIRYIVDGQGDPMAVFEAGQRYDLRCPLPHGRGSANAVSARQGTGA